MNAVTSTERVRKKNIAWSQQTVDSSKENIVSRKHIDFYIIMLDPRFIYGNKSCNKVFRLMQTSFSCPIVHCMTFICVSNPYSSSWNSRSRNFFFIIFLNGDGCGPPPYVYKHYVYLLRHLPSAVIANNRSFLDVLYFDTNL